MRFTDARLIGGNKKGEPLRLPMEGMYEGKKDQLKVGILPTRPKRPVPVVLDAVLKTSVPCSVSKRPPLRTMESPPAKMMVTWLPPKPKLTRLLPPTTKLLEKPTSPPKFTEAA